MKLHFIYLSIILIILSLVFSVISVLFFLNGESINICLPINSDKFGDFGSFFGGVLGTIIALIGLIALFVTYFYQRMQNELYQINQLFSTINEDINNIMYKEYKGINALLKFDKDHANDEVKDARNSVMNDLVLILSSFENLFERITKSRFIGKENVESNLARSYLMFNSKITWPVWEKILKEFYFENENDPANLKEHTDAPIIFSRLFRIIRDSYNYLRPKGLILLPENNDKMMAIINGEIK